jgi:hypothetical protein
MGQCCPINCTSFHSLFLMANILSTFSLHQTKSTLVTLRFMAVWMLWALSWMVLARSHDNLNTHATFTSTEPIYIFTSKQWNCLGLFFIWSLYTFFPGAFLMIAKVITYKGVCHWQHRDKEGDRSDEHITQYSGNREQREWFQIKGQVTESAPRLKKEYSCTTTALCVCMACYRLSCHRRCIQNSQGTCRSDLNKTADMQKHG